MAAVEMTNNFAILSIFLWKIFDEDTRQPLHTSLQRSAEYDAFYTVMFLISHA